MLKIALYEIQTGHHSPDQWAKDTCDRRCLQWLGLGIAPSRSRWYAFRDRVGPLLETFHRQILEGAVAQGLTTASRGSLDGTLIAAHASRHRLVNLSRLRRRLEELDRVIAADKTRQDPGPIPGWMARHPATRQRQRYRFREAQRKLLKEHARNAAAPATSGKTPRRSLSVPAISRPPWAGTKRRSSGRCTTCRSFRTSNRRWSWATRCLPRRPTPGP